MITVVGLGPGDPEDLTSRAISLLHEAGSAGATGARSEPAGSDESRAASAGAGVGIRLFLRTDIHPTVATLREWGLRFESFDRLYQEGPTFEEVYRGIARRLLAEGRIADIVFAVPGHPLVGEQTVAMLLEQSEVPVKVVAGISALDAIFARLGVDPAAGLQVLDALAFTVGQGHERPPDWLPDRPTLVLQVFSPQRAAEAKLALMAYYADEHPVTVLRAAGVPGQERIETVPLFEIDRLPWVDHLTSLYLPPGPVRGVRRLEALMHRLRAPGGCPWDREQTHESLRRYCLEEAYEVVDAIDAHDDDALEEELGDLLLQVVFHAELGTEDGRFTLVEIADRICDKLVARHPQIFGDEAEARTASEHLARWEELKAREKPRGTSAIAGVPLALPALTASEKLQSRAARVGFEWANWHGAVSKLREEVTELQAEFDAASESEPWKDEHRQAAVNHEIGDVFTAAVNVARFWKLDPEQALRDANARFKRRFEVVERLAGGSIEGRNLDELLSFWTRAKAEVG